MFFCIVLANQSITKDGVQYILNTVFPSLEQDPARKFSYCESNFFWRWWNQQNDATKQKVTNLVNQGIPELYVGGTMHDISVTKLQVNWNSLAAVGYNTMRQPLITQQWLTRWPLAIVFWTKLLADVVFRTLDGKLILSVTVENRLLLWLKFVYTIVIHLWTERRLKF